MLILIKLNFLGFISITSLSTPESNLVIDGLYRGYHTKHQLKHLIESPDILKIFCGADNDIFRMQRNWQCYPVGLIDIQDMFVVFKETAFSKCLDMCRPAIKARLGEKSPKKVITDQDISLWLHDLTKPGKKNCLLTKAFVFKC